MWDCSGCEGCSGTCSGTCSGGCSGGCSNSCTNSCKNACNKGCSTAESKNLAELTLSDVIENTNVANIARLIYLEAQRRSKQPSSTTFTEGVSVQASEINKIVSNLALINQTVTATSAGTEVKKTFGQSLIEKALAAYNTQINLS
jgi:hypothetical protein